CSARSWFSSWAACGAARSSPRTPRRWGWRSSARSVIGGQRSAIGIGHVSITDADDRGRDQLQLPTELAVEGIGAAAPQGDGKKDEAPGQAGLPPAPRAREA